MSVFERTLRTIFSSLDDRLNAYFTALVTTEISHNGGCVLQLASTRDGEDIDGLIIFLRSTIEPKVCEVVSTLTDTVIASSLPVHMSVGDGELFAAQQKATSSSPR